MRIVLNDIVNLMRNIKDTGSLINRENIHVHNLNTGDSESVHENEWNVQQFSHPKCKLKWYSAFYQSSLLLKNQPV